MSLGECTAPTNTRGWFLMSSYGAYGAIVKNFSEKTFILIMFVHEMEMTDT